MARRHPDGQVVAVRALSSCPREVIAAVAKTVEVVHAAVAEQRGVLQFFNGDHFVATFNAAATCSRV